MPLAIVLCLAFVLGAAALLFEPADDPAAAPLRPDPVARIAERVERARGLTFRRDPAPRSVTAREARAEALASLDRDYPPAKRRADARVLELLGLLPPGTDLADILGETYEAAVAGYYDPRSGRLRIVEGAQTANRVLYEMTVAHELTHALEDQRFGFDLELMAAGDDPALAYSALIEGTATALMFRYVGERFGPEEAFGGIAASAFAPTGDLPPFVMAQLTFPYTAGETFVNRLLEVGNGSWSVVDAALRFRPPASTEQVMHPQKYLDVEQPQRVGLRGPTAALGSGWRRLHEGVLGEWLTGRLLARAGGTAAPEAAAGWGGDRYALLERGGEHALLARWTWDRERDADEFTAALRAWGNEGLPDSEPAGAGAWRTPDGAAAMRRRGDVVTLALAPGAGLARRVAAAAG